VSKDIVVIARASAASVAWRVLSSELSACAAQLASILERNAVRG
jgi:hypothetical protein